MAELSLDEKALKDRFLQRAQRADWSEEDFKGVLFAYKNNAQALLQAAGDLVHPEGFSHADLQELDAKLSPLLEMLKAELAARSMKVSGFSVMAVAPAKRVAFKLLDYFPAFALGLLVGVAGGMAWL